MSAIEVAAASGFDIRQGDTVVNVDLTSPQFGRHGMVYASRIYRGRWVCDVRYRGERTVRVEYWMALAVGAKA